MNFKSNTNSFLFATSLIIGSLIANPAASFAQTHQKAHFGLAYPISTNGVHAAQISNTISLHALVGLSAGEDGAAISGLSTIIKGEQSGTVISGLSNTIDGSAQGIQVAGLINTIGGDSKGFTAAGLVNATKSVNGLQIAGLTNLSGGDATAQIVGLTNVSKSASIQIGGLSNHTKSSRGLQVAGLINTAENSKAQIAGLINISKKAKGVQIAGLVNVADESHCPIGIINIVKDGEMQIGATIDEVGNTILAFRSGGKYTYGIIGAGINWKMYNAPYVLEVGFGAHLPIYKSLRLNLELSNTANTDFWQDSYYKTSFRPLLGLTLAKRIEIVAGPSFNYVNYLSVQQLYRENAVYNFWGAQSTNSLFFGGMAGIHVKI